MYKISFYEKPFEEIIFENLEDALYYGEEILTEAYEDKIITGEELLECVKELFSRCQVSDFLIIQEYKE